MDNDQPKKGHWKKGRSRNLEPRNIAAARNLLDLLGRAVGKGWRHLTLGELTVSKTATLFKVRRETVYKWLRGRALPPLWAVEQLRELLRDFSP